MATYIELKQQAEALLKEAEELKRAELAAVVKEIKTKMISFGLTLQDLKAAGVEPGKPPIKPGTESTIAKFKGPNGELWSGGRGRKPDWALKVIATYGAPGLEKYRL